MEAWVLANARSNERERPHEHVQIVPWPSVWDPKRIGYRILEVIGVEKYLQSSWRERWPEAIRVVEQISPDVIHAHFGRAGVKAVPIAHALGIPLVVTFYGYDVSKLSRDEGWRRGYEKIWHGSDVIVGISSHICEKLISMGAPKDKVKRISLGVDLGNFECSSPTSNFDGHTVRCLHVGRLVEKKGPLHLVRAIRNARRRLENGRDLHLTIAGDGPLRTELEKFITEAGIQDHFSLLGAVSHEKVRELMKETHLYTQHCVTASDGDQEGQGVTFVEASATGRPVVSTRHDGIPDVVLDGETGILVEEGDVEGMGEAIANLARNTKQWIEFGRAGRSHIEKNFNLSTQIEKQIDVYEEVS